MSNRSTFSDYAARLREFIGRSPFLGCGELDQRFHLLALELFALQFAHNQPYRRFCDGRRISPETISQWTNIPAVPAAAFKELELTSLPADQRAAVFHSSGTTGQKPGRHFHDVESLSIYELSLATWFKTHLMGADRKLPMLFLTPSPSLAPHSSLVHMFETVRREFGTEGSVFAGTTGADGSWEFEVENVVLALNEVIRADCSLVLLGTAFNFVHLLDLLAKRNRALRLPEGSRVLETGGYKGRSRVVPKAELHALITEHLGIPGSHIISEYGMSELSSQAYDSKAPRAKGQGPGLKAPGAERVFRFPPWARAQIILPETGREAGEGEAGLIRVIDLANLRSAMAIQTEDLGVRRGDGFELIGRVAVAEPRGCSLMTAW